ncbi:MAG: hypothetical protein V1742_04650 [Pseudomonadota bacterium]
MKLELIDPPREFIAGRGNLVQKDCARILLEPEEQVTFLTESGGEYDLARKSWGFYATPSLNGRLIRYGLRAVLVRGPEDKFYLHLVESGREEEHRRYLEQQGMIVVCWLDRTEALIELAGKVSS